MHEIDKIYSAYKLKEINRKGKVGKRFESTAEHTFSTLFLAEYFFTKIKNINRERVRKLILYHDFCEIYAGDSFTINETPAYERQKEKLENLAVKKLAKELPREIGKELTAAWSEWTENKTRESKLAKAIDVFDPIINAMHQPKEWKKRGFTEEKLRIKKEKYFKDFPEIQYFFEEVVKELLRRRIIPKK